jgi:hypothetical protein
MAIPMIIDRKMTLLRMVYNSTPTSSWNIEIMKSRSPLLLAFEASVV